MWLCNLFEEKDIIASTNKHGNSQNHLEFKPALSLQHLPRHCFSSCKSGTRFWCFVWIRLLPKFAGYQKVRVKRGANQWIYLLVFDQKLLGIVYNVVWWASQWFCGHYCKCYLFYTRFWHYQLHFIRHLSSLSEEFSWMLHLDCMLRRINRWQCAIPEPLESEL